MKHFRTLLPLLLGLIVLSCSETEHKDRITLTGNIRNADGERLLFREMAADSIHDLDSLVLDDKGLFRFTTRSSEPGFYILKFASGPGIILSFEKGDEPVISADLKNKPFAYAIKGSPGSEILKDFISLTQKNLAKADSLRSVLMTNRESPDFYRLSLKFDTLFQDLIHEQRNLEISFIDKNSSSLVSLIILNYNFGMGPVLDPESDLPLFIKLDSNLTSRYPSNRNVAFLHSRIIDFQRQKKEGKEMKIE
jgi:hypothetical protein